jgi:hypothetical protein
MAAASFFLDYSVIHQEPDFHSYHSNAPPLSRHIRLAQLQSYLI